MATLLGFRRSSSAAVLILHQLPQGLQMRCLSSSWLDPHQTQLPFTLGKSSKNAATPFHCLHVEQKYGVSPKKNTSHVQKMFPWEMLRKWMKKVVILPQHLHFAQLQSDIHCIICRKPAKSTPSSSANSSSGGSSSCDIEPG